MTCLQVLEELSTLESTRLFNGTGISKLPDPASWRTPIPADRTGLAFRVVLAEGDAKIFELTKA